MHDVVVNRIPEQALSRAARAASALPTSVQLALSGGPIIKDGQMLEPEVALLLRLGDGAGLNKRRPLAEQRALQNRHARIVGGRPYETVTRDFTIDAPHGSIPVRHYAATEPGAPLLVFLHGGGFVFGDLDTHDGPCRVLCRHGGMNILAVDYRLAPENRFPAAVEDARVALSWAQANAESLGADPARVGIGGDSAGANLAAVTSLAAKDDGPPHAQLLVYPAICRRTPWPSLELFADGFYLTRDAIEWFHRQYVGREHHKVARGDTRLNPLAAEDLRGVARALIVTAGFDPLRDEGEAYAAALRKADNHVTVRRFGSLIHGFFNMVGVSRACREAVIEIAGAARMLFAPHA